MNQSEKNGVKIAREQNPLMSQRGLAKFVHDDYTTFGVGQNRTLAAIYGVIRRLDRAAKSTVDTARDSRIRKSFAHG